MKSIKTSLLVIGSAVVSLSVASAANIHIEDGPPLTPEGVVTFQAADFERGFFLNGALIQGPGLGGGPVAAVPEGPPADFSGSWFAPGGFAPVDRTVYFVEPGSSLVSDILQYHATSDGVFGTITGSFTSDATEGGLGLVPAGAEVWDESKGEFDFSLPFLTGQVISDAADVPENGAGLAGMAALVGVCLLGYLNRRSLATA